MHGTPFSLDRGRCCYDYAGHLMPNYKRTYQAGGMFFFTLVTHRRRHLFSESTAIEYLREAIAQEKAQHPFDLTAIAAKLT